MLMLTLPVAAIYSVNDGEISIGVLGQLTVAATAVYLGVRWVARPADGAPAVHGRSARPLPALGPRLRAAVDDST